MIDIKDALQQAQKILLTKSDSARLDAEVLLSFVLQSTRTFLYTHGEKQLTNQQLNRFNQLVNQRLTGQPIAYLIGQREFWSLPLKVTPDTLIPRPETELLVELTLQLLAENPHATLLDLGTGSGAIALALASERSTWNIYASDDSAAALAVAEHNAAHLRLQWIYFYHSHWFESLPPILFDAIISNPPYIAQHDHHLNVGDLRFEPQHALISGEAGLDDLIHIIKHSYDRLMPGGLLLVEHGYQQKNAVGELFNQVGYQDITCWQDNQGHDRVSGGRKPKLPSR